MIAEVFVVGIAFLLGYGVARGFKEHMEPEPDDPLPPVDVVPPKPPVSIAVDCDAHFDKIPTGSSDIDNLRNAVKKLYTYASTIEDAKTLETTADGLDVIGHTEAAKCLREKAKEIRKTKAIFPLDAGVDTVAKGIVFPTG